MLQRKSNAEWRGNLKSGKGQMRLGSGSFVGAYSFGSRFGEEQGTNPEELIAAAHAGCFSMALAHELDQQGYTPHVVKTEANIFLEKQAEGFAITSIILKTKVHADGVDQDTFSKIAEQAKSGCPVSRALTGVTIKLEAELTGAES